MEKQEPGNGEITNWITYDDIKMDLKHKRIVVGTLEKSLLDREYKVLLLLMQHPNEVLSVQCLYENVWTGPYLYSSIAVVTECMVKIMSKIEEYPVNKQRIRVVQEKGYQLI